MKKEIVLNSILKNVPLEMKKEISLYATKNSKHSLRWKARQPVDDCPQGIRDTYNNSGSLPFQYAKTADLYVNIDSKFYDGVKQGRSDIYHEKQLLKDQLQSRENDIESLQERIRNLVKMSDQKHKEKMETHLKTFTENQKLKEEMKDYKNALKSLTTFISKNL